MQRCVGLAETCTLRERAQSAAKAACDDEQMPQMSMFAMAKEAMRAGDPAAFGLSGEAQRRLGQMVCAIDEVKSNVRRGKTAHELLIQVHASALVTPSGEHPSPPFASSHVAARPFHRAGLDVLHPRFVALLALVLKVPLEEELGLACREVLRARGALEERALWQRGFSCPSFFARRAVRVPQRARVPRACPPPPLARRGEGTPPRGSHRGRLKPLDDTRTMRL